MKYSEFIKEVGKHGGPTDREHAEEVTRIVLATLGERLAGMEPHNLASQLPQELQNELLVEVGSAEFSDDIDDFLRRIADRESRDCGPETALSHAQAVLGTMSSFVSAGEINNLRSQLPAGYAPLFQPVSSG